MKLKENAIYLWLDHSIPDLVGCSIWHKKKFKVREHILKGHQMEQYRQIVIISLKNGLNTLNKYGEAILDENDQIDGKKLATMLDEFPPTEADTKEYEIIHLSKEEGEQL